MRDADCVAFLRWCLPRLRLRWPGYRRVRRQVCKRIRRRLGELGLADAEAYRRYLEGCPEEWRQLDGLCRITISRFFRDRGVFAALEDHVLPVLAATARARGERVIRCWSVGCASGEEAYSLRILWDLGPGGAACDLRLEVLGTDADPIVIERARRGCYRPGSLRDVPSELRDRAFERRGGGVRVRADFRNDVRFRREDVRRRRPRGPFHLVLCRNLVFTYFDEPLQQEVLGHIESRVVPGGALVIGGHERLPTMQSFVVDPVEPTLHWRRRCARIDVSTADGVARPRPEAVGCPGAPYGRLADEPSPETTSSISTSSVPDRGRPSRSR